jgi:hypothetical protein
VVDFHLRKLGLGEVQFTKKSRSGYRLASRVAPQGLGVCRAYVLTEAAWPEGADLCVLVDWSPDAALRRNPQEGTIPAGAEEHWRERITATARALESLGYIVEPSRFRRSPRYHPSAELLVYRMPEGEAPRRVLAHSDWALPGPVPPNYQHPVWSYRDQSPCDIVDQALRKAGLAKYAEYGDSSAGMVTVRSITQTVWPPEADRCAWLTWQPATRFKPDPATGTLPDGAESHWRISLARLEQAMQDAGLDCRTRTRPWDPSTDEEVPFLVYRTRPLP